jgi:hypothetical protein
MERLGKEISVLKLKVAECSTAIEESAARQNGIGQFYFFLYFCSTVVLENVNESSR